MNLEKIMASMHTHSSPFVFSEIAEDVIVQMCKEKFSKDINIKIERAIERELMRVSKNNNFFSRKESKRTYPDYSKQYYSRLHYNYELVEMSCVVDAINAASVVYVGDFHPLKSPKTCLRDLLKKINNVPVNLCLECLPQFKQNALDKYAGGNSGIVPFGSDWYRPVDLFGKIIDFAKNRMGTKIIGIGPKNIKDGDFSTSDRIMAPVIAQNASTGVKTIVFVGDYHVAPEHLPAKVSNIFGKTNDLILYQNSTRIYWHLQKRMEKMPSAVKLSDKEYCLFNTTPLIKYQSAIDQFSEEKEDDCLHIEPEQKVDKILCVVYLLLLLEDTSLKKCIEE